MSFCSLYVFPQPSMDLSMPSIPLNKDTPPSPPPLPPPTNFTADPKPENAVLYTLLEGKVIKEPVAGYRQIWLCCYRNYLFAGHWFIFVPSQSNDGCGTVINVRGNTKEGFRHEFERLNRPPWSSTPGPARLQLGNIKNAWIDPEAPYPPDENTVDTTPFNSLERLALEVPAPAPSLNSAQGPAPGKRVQQVNCQSWIKSLVSHLIDKAGDDFELSRPDILDLAPEQ